MRRVTTATLAFFGVLCVFGAVRSFAEGGVGLGVGIVKFQDCDECNTPLWVTGNLRVKVNRNFALEPEAGWYRQKEELADVTTNAFNFGGSALILIPSEQVELFGGGGAGAHMFRVSYAGSSETETRFGFHFLGGADLKVSDGMNLFGAIRYEIIDGDPENLKQWKFYGGIRLVTP